MSPDLTRGLLDTNIVILRHAIDPDELPDEMAISAITLAELSAGVHLVGGDVTQAIEERARRADVLQRAENEFDPIPFDTESARMFGRISAAVQARGRTSRRRIADLMIASIAAVVELPLYTTNSADFDGLEGILPVVAVRRPAV
ncbi:MAG: type II toxin-antitoxin system VapC family toxin [Actinomycetia bacterium]|nr:type II toxin-antitoxin system VapC family toxin [Actinomycetes bacterium]